MPDETTAAVQWAMQQQVEVEPGLIVPVSLGLPWSVVDKVREYFNSHGVPYQSFSFVDVGPFLPTE